MYQWPLRNTGQAPSNGTNDADIDLPEAWDYETDADGVLVAIIDSGIPCEPDNSTLTHEDLDDSEKILIGPVYADGESYIDDYRGHGTHVAGIIAAETNNSTGIAGIIWSGQVLIIKAIDGWGYISSGAATNAINYAVDYADTSSHELIINGSFHAYTWAQNLETAVIGAHDSGALQVYCAGNDKIDTVALPALYAHKNFQSEFPPSKMWPGYGSVLSVGATDHNDERPSYSNYDTTLKRISLAAPGGGSDSIAHKVFSTLPEDEYGYMSGTSMAAPHVSGLAALAWERFPNLTATEIRTLLEKASEDVNNNGFDHELGHGRINAFYTLAPPSAPVNLRLSGTQGQNPILTWNANIEPDLESYEIYKKEGISNWFHTASVNCTTETWTDGSVEIGDKFDPFVYYKITAEDYTEQESGYSNFVSTRLGSSSKEIADSGSNNIPTTYALSDAYPNPFNPSTTIKYQLPKTTKVNINIYDISGRVIWSQVNSNEPAGYYSIVWSGAKSTGDQSDSGVYLIELTTPEFRAVKKAVFIR